MKRTIFFLSFMCLSYLSMSAQTYTFNMYNPNNNVNYTITVNTSSKTLSAKSNGSSVFSVNYYAWKENRSQGRIGFALKSDRVVDMEGTSNAFFIITQGGGTVIQLNGSNYPLLAKNNNSHTSTYNQLVNALNNSSSPTPSVSSGSNRTFTANGVSFTMVYVQGGTFTMGATSEQGSDAESDEKPTHRVTLSSYYIGQTEVTQALWQAVMGSNPSYFTGNSSRPVERVSWNDCQTFIRKLNSLTGQHFRLPTEAEWEFAARGGNNSRGYKYSGSNTIGDVAWYSVNNGSSTYPVATKSSNELGIYDMSGNVWEWCNDWYGSYSSSSQTNPQGPSSGSDRVLRGGSWLSFAGDCRVSYRVSNTPGGRISVNGLRLAL